MNAADDLRDPRWIAGGDARIPAEILDVSPERERPAYDSVVVRGSGVGALTLAGRLARSRSLAGKVVVAAARPVESRRLVNGCTLRSRSIDYYAAAFGTSREIVLRAMYGERWREAESRTQVAAAFTRNADGSYELGKTQVWSRSSRWHDLPLAYGTRNGRLVGALAGLLEPLAPRWHGSLPASLEECRAIAPGKNPLVVNATHEPLAGAPPRKPPRRFVVAAQMVFTAPRRRALGRIADAQALVCASRRGPAMDTAVYYPFVDPLSPSAEFYGIFYRMVTPGTGFDRARETAILRENVIGVGRSFGLEPLDEAETLGTAYVPCWPFRDESHRHGNGFLDFEAIYGAGVPIITGCGMSRAGLAGLVTAQAILAGADAAAVTNRSLRGWRIANLAFALGLSTLAPITDPLLRRVPGHVLNWIANYRNFWAGVPAAPAATF